MVGTSPKELVDSHRFRALASDEDASCEENTCFFRIENEVDITDHLKMTGDWVKCDYNRTDHWQPSNWAPGADDVVKLTDDNFSDENLIKSDIWKENMSSWNDQCDHPDDNLRWVWTSSCFSSLRCPHSTFLVGRPLPPQPSRVITWSWYASSILILILSPQSSILILICLLNHVGW